MSETEFKNFVAGKLIEFRKKSGLTQAELAEMINYSDKAVSKWERGESLPDVYTLMCVAEKLNVSINELLTDDYEVSKKDCNEYKKYSDKEKMRRHILITTMSVALVWLVASVVFFILNIIHFNIFTSEMIFLYAIPCSFIVLLVFSCIWFSQKIQCIGVSGIIWSVAVSVFLTLHKDTSYVFIIAVIMQILTLLWYTLKSVSKK